MAESLPFAFTPIERVALETIREERPVVVTALHDRLALVLDDLVRTFQGWIVTEAAAEDLLLRLRGEFVGRMMAEMEPWGEDEDLRRSVVDLLTRHRRRCGRGLSGEWSGRSGTTVS